jgi:hypothetical protein
VSDHVCPESIKRAMAAAAVIGALTLAGCAVETGFPAVHDMPQPRAETTLTPDQVKEATDSLISQREHLSTEAQSAQPLQTAATPASPAAAAQQKQPATPAKATAAAPTDDATGATSIGAYAKP